jgi:hypothetical protein
MTNQVRDFIYTAKYYQVFRNYNRYTSYEFVELICSNRSIVFGPKICVSSKVYNALKYDLIYLNENLDDRKHLD